MSAFPNYVQENLRKIARQEGFISYTIEYINSDLCEKSATSLLGRVVIRDKINGSDLWLIFKILFNENYVTDFWNSTKLFEREIHFYTNIWPKMKQFQKQHHRSPNTEPFDGIPQVYRAICDPDRNEFLLILEDLEMKNYKSYKKPYYFDENIIKLTLTSLAKFHAISFAMREQESNLFHQMKSSLSDIYVSHRKSHSLIHGFMKDSLDGAFATLLENDLVEKEKLGMIKNEFIKHMEECVNVEASEPFGVICHGDMYAFNLLFKHDKYNIPNAVQFVDWQLSRFASPTLDVINFILISTTKEIRDKSYDDLIKHYYKSLSVGIQNLGSSTENLIKFTDFQNHCHKFGKFVVLTAPSLVMWLTGIQQNIAPSLANLFEYLHTSTFKLKIYGNPSSLYKKIMRNLIVDANSPQYIATSDLDKELELQYRVHAALDVVEEKCDPSQKPTPDSRDLYLGLLYSTENHKIYGYVTNTKIKFVIVVDSANTALRENEIRSMFRSLHTLYTDAVCNPFYIPGESLISKKFDKNVRNIMTGTV